MTDCMLNLITHNLLFNTNNIQAAPCGFTRNPAEAVNSSGIKSRFCVNLGHKLRLHQMSSKSVQTFLRENNQINIQTFLFIILLGILRYTCVHKFWCGIIICI